MIIPIGHDRTVSRWPWVTIAIIAACALVQIYSQSVTPTTTEMLRDRAHALELLGKSPIVMWGYVTGTGFNSRLFTAAFVHAGWIHLIGNMLFLWLAGAPLEDRWGPIKFGLFYAVGIVASTYAFEATFHGPTTILVGASGAISAVMGAFLVLFGSTEIMFFYWFVRASGTFRLAAYFALPLWLADQVLYASLVGTTGVTNVAYAAHIGGFATGVAVALVARFAFRSRDDHDDEHAATSEAPPAASPRPRVTDDRLDRLYTAIRARDRGEVRTLASRVVLDRSRAGDHRVVVDVYDALGELRADALTDGAYAAAVKAAEALARTTLRDDIVAELRRVHPGSALAKATGPTPAR